MIRPIKLTLACVAVFVVSAVKLQAGVILSPGSVSTPMDTNLFSQPLAKIHDGFGILPSFTSDVDDFVDYTTQVNTPEFDDGGGHTWFSNDNLNSLKSSGDNYLNFDFGTERTIEGIAYWGVDNSLGSIRDFTIFTSIDNVVFVDTGEPDLTFGTGTISPSNPVVVQDIVDISTRYLRLQIDSINGGDSQFVGIGEIAFNATAVPEPSSLAILGVGACAFAARRRRRAKTQVATA